jgi:hypothetical protein
MKRNKHSLSHYRLFSANMGSLVPIGLTEVLPGDTFQHSTSMLVRVSPLLAPVMHPVSVRVHHWYIPNRLLWENWQDFITGGPDGFDTSEFPTITLAAADRTVGSLADYLGVPPEYDPPATDLSVSALPFRAYALVFNEWYRDQDLVDPLDVSIEDGVDTTTNLDLQNIAWERDYFTSARPFTQKGPEIQLPLSGEAPISGLGKSNQNWEAGATTVYETGQSGVSNWTSSQLIAGNEDQDTWFQAQEDPDNPGFPNIRADLSAVSATNVNDLRLAFALQRYEEARARYGSRYTEYLRYLGVKSSDARLQRPEYLGGGKQTLQFSEVLQTAPDSQSQVGDLKGHGIGAMRSNRYRRFFEEHGFVLSLCSVRPRTMYTQGLAKHWNRRSKEDYWQKELQHIGQQEIANKEIYAEAANPDGVFGYQDRYEEYRRQPSNIAGEFRTEELDFWHMGRVFDSEPVLNESFVTSVPTQRIHAVQTNDVLWCMANHSIQARRLVAKTGKSFIY